MRATTSHIDNLRTTINVLHKEATCLRENVKDLNFSLTKQHECAANLQSCDNNLRSENECLKHAITSSQGSTLPLINKSTFLEEKNHNSLHEDDLPRIKTSKDELTCMKEQEDFTCYLSNACEHLLHPRPNTLEINVCRELLFATKLQDQFYSAVNNNHGITHNCLLCNETL